MTNALLYDFNPRKLVLPLEEISHFLRGQPHFDPAGTEASVLLVLQVHRFNDVFLGHLLGFGIAVFVEDLFQLVDQSHRFGAVLLTAA
ncbi:hypothetical protein D1872_234700 [compost metagenome]